jgi:hypothetical protein
MGYPRTPEEIARDERLAETQKRRYESGFYGRDMTKRIEQFMRENDCDRESAERYFYPEKTDSYGNRIGSRDPSPLNNPGCAPMAILLLAIGAVVGCGDSKDDAVGQSVSPHIKQFSFNAVGSNGIILHSNEGNNGAAFNY